MHAPGIDALVVDNASGDDSIARIRAAHPQATRVDYGDGLIHIFALRSAIDF